MEVQEKVLEPSFEKYFDEYKSAIEDKFKQFKEKLKNKKDELKTEVRKKIYELQILNKEVNSKQESLNQDLNKKDQLVEETKKLKSDIEKLINEMEDLEKFSENLKNQLTCDLLKIEEDDFVLKTYFNKKTGSDKEDSAALVKRDHCRFCNNKMVFKENHYYSSCLYGNNACSNKTLYECNFCQRGYCTNCAYPPDIDNCGCGALLAMDNRPSHSCDICGVSLMNFYRRCSAHDYDVCDNCYHSRKINKTN